MSVPVAKKVTEEQVIQRIKETAQQPLQKQNGVASRFSIQNAFKEKEVEVEVQAIKPQEKLPNNHFSQSDLEQSWERYLKTLKTSDIVIYSAVQGFKFLKKGENIIEVHYPSDSAKSKFDKIQAEFFNKFKHKVNHFNLEINFVLDVALKKEIVTKKSIFEKYVEINPLLKDLDDLIKFDFS